MGLKRGDMGRWRCGLFSGVFISLPENRKQHLHLADRFFENEVFCTFLFFCWYVDMLDSFFLCRIYFTNINMFMYLKLWSNEFLVHYRLWQEYKDVLKVDFYSIKVIDEKKSLSLTCSLFFELFLFFLMIILLRYST